MRIPKKNIIACHEYDEKDVSLQMFRAAFFGRNERVIDRVAVAIANILPPCNYLINANADALNVARTVSEKTDIPIIFRSNIGRVVLQNAQVCIIAGRSTDAHGAYAALMMRFPLKIWVAAFLQD